VLTHIRNRSRLTLRVELRVVRHRRVTVYVHESYRNS
jgi:hypothetical protein